MSDALILTPKNLINEYLMYKRYQNKDAAIIIEQQDETQTMTQKVKGKKSKEIVQDVFHVYLVVPSASNKVDEEGNEIAGEQRIYVGITRSGAGESKIKAYTNHSTPVSELHKALTQADPKASMNFFMKLNKPYEVSKQEKEKTS